MPQGQDRLSLPKKSGLGSRAPGQRLQARALRIVVVAHGSWMTATRLRGATAKPAATNGTLRQQQRGRSTDAAPHESQHALSAHRRCKRCKLAMSTRSATTISPTTNAGVPSKCRPFASARTRAFHLRWPDLAFPLELLNVKAYTRCDLESDPSTGGNHKGAVEFVELSLFSRGECGKGWELGIRSQDRELFDHKLQIGFMLEAFW